MDRLGIHTANLGLPGWGRSTPRGHPATGEEIRRICKLRIQANVACRTVISDIEPVVEISQAAGIPIEVCAFIGSSQIRQVSESWSPDSMLQHTRTALKFCQDHDLPVMYVTEDTFRARSPRP